MQKPHRTDALRVNAALNGCAAQQKIRLREIEPNSGGNPNLPFYKIDPVTSSLTGCSTCSRVFISIK